MAQVKALSLGGLGSPCCCGGGPPPSCIATICVTGCGQAVPDALVVIGSKDCTTVLSMDTFSACCTIDVGTPGTYTIVVGATGFETSTGDYDVDCVDQVSIDLTPTAETGCGCSGRCPAVPATLTGSDGLGSFTLAWDAGTGTWHGCAMRSAVDLPTFDPACTNPMTGTVSIPVYFTFGCDPFSDGGFHLLGQIATCSDGTPIRGIDCTFVPAFFQTVLDDSTDNLPSSCIPFDWAGNGPAAGCNALNVCVTPAQGCAIYGCPPTGTPLTVTA